MKKNSFYTLAGIALTAMSFTACNDYDAAAIDYEDVELTPSSTTAEAPKLEDDWQLKQVINIGQHDDNVFVYQDNLYNNLFARTLGWTGGEVQSSVKMPDGSVVFVVRDSYFGTVDADTRARTSGNLVKNALLQLTTDNGTLSQPSSNDLYCLNNYVQTTDPTGEKYYYGEPLMKHTSSTYHYWPGVACAYNGKLQVQWTAYRSSLGRRDVTSIATYTTNGKPADAGYLQQESLSETIFKNYIAYDDCLWQDEDGHNYMYCAYPLSGINGVLVARTATHDLTSEWEYCILDTNGEISWTKNIPTATATTASDEALRSNMLEQNAACQHPQVMKKGDYYYLIGQSYQNLNDVRIWRSETPYGPFKDVKTLFVVPETVNKLGNQYYNTLTRVVLHPSLSRDGELVLSTAQTAPATDDNFTYKGSADYVKPNFYRIYNWESLFE